MMSKRVAACALAVSLGSVTANAFALTPNWAGNLAVSALDVSVVSRGSNLLDMFRAVGSAGLMYDRYAGGWAPSVSLSGSGAPSCHHVAAALNGTRIDLVCASMDGHAYHVFSDNTGVFPQIPIPAAQWEDLGTLASRGGCNDSAVTMTSWGPGRLDLFYVVSGPQGGCATGGAMVLGHKWADNNRWAGIETGNDPGRWFLQPVASASGPGYLAATSWGANRIDIIWGGTGTNFNVGHHWFDGNSNNWGTAQAPNKETLALGGPNGPLEVAVSSSAAGALDVFALQVTSSGTSLQAKFFSNFNHWSATKTVTLPGGTPTPSIASAIRWNGGGARLDIFGANEGNTFNSIPVWQAYFLPGPSGADIQ